MNDTEYYKAIERCNKMHDLYLSTFGEHSLDRAIYCDPLDDSVDSINETTRKLANAIANNQPFEQMPEELWQEIIF
ncbi:hypothetical protein [Veillonella sp. CNR 79/14]|jgi:hypothetical protein|uniref:hypothetical protein n=1 Tax=Veillonella sp. CNR 79/14 TaxID=2490954 RepID=UPI000F8CFCC1|nr:hypothetical protein [Veillonella sp. CNR 79/14]DAT29635.1 MAG TPA: Golgi resident protein GCP60, 3A, GOLD, 3A, Aichivirus, Antiviral.0A [Caudoviricetes sp.]DAV28046.1 MAG TPA: Golgi resident protein GCP60, 3A, GOLD, 3A, Aichivirus, Antiviral.0A [Caudoviricetes sp.]